MQVELGQQFSRDLAELADILREFPERVQGRLKKAHERIGVRWKAEAIERAPVDEATLKQRIVTNTTQNGRRELETVTGTNVPYAPFLEFGTRHIAGGRVRAIGDDAHVTDAQAITIWPAKNAGIVDNATGVAAARVVSAIQRRLDRGGSQEQMPFLRPAWAAISDWALEQIIDAIAEA